MYGLQTQRADNQAIDLSSVSEYCRDRGIKPDYSLQVTITIIVYKQMADALHLDQASGPIGTSLQIQYVDSRCRTFLPYSACILKWIFAPGSSPFHCFSLQIVSHRLSKIAYQSRRVCPSSIPIMQTRTRLASCMVWKMIQFIRLAMGYPWTVIRTLPTFMSSNTCLSLPKTNIVFRHNIQPGQGSTDLIFSRNTLPVSIMPEWS